MIRADRKLAVTFAILGVLEILGAADALADWTNFSSSLHRTRAGKDYWYQTSNGGFEAFTGVPIEDLGCKECHGPTNAEGQPYEPWTGADCGDCHKNDMTVSVSQCYSCHGRQKTEAVALGLPDVHRSAGMVCWDCHSVDDIHGDGTTYASMLEPGAIDADCTDCHPSPSATHATVDPHDGKLHCTACHAQTVISCYNCHFESQVEHHVKRAKQPIHGFVILGNRVKDGKVGTLSFQSLTYQGSAFAAFGPFTPHSIIREGRTCTDCHVNLGGSNPSILEYNATGQIQFAAWNESDSTLSWKQGVVPMPFDYVVSFKMDFLTYNGATSDPAGPSKNWSSIGKDTFDGQQMFFAGPLSPAQMAALGFENVTGAPVSTVGEARLVGAMPNPFNPQTEIAFHLDSPREVVLEIFDPRGRLIRVLDLGQQPAGRGRAPWDGTDQAGQRVASGTYRVLLVSSGGHDELGVTLIK